MHIVLVEPEIHTNTGNIGRLSLASGCSLHLIKPFGFELTDARLKRAGLDYWQHIDLYIYENFEEFEKLHADKPKVFTSSKAIKNYTEIRFEEETMIIFGKESKGLDSAITDKYTEDLYNIPMRSDKIRSINLANSVAIVVYEGLRQLNIS
ncbi:tRNA (uridine(34)/cytosine(34)/5-carboxymethylaminomethyluridine(34)-2'-O)-methyltransferase TrmL [Nonlabens spongiae]|uniref:Putative tRNA (cytidine(34)-2'-O)-methyltransferase n=1 Tax=Nonlabens spongiae TaxID=331648 RepID=A0A1W6MGZ0_9FLAO|nr:tRNA (cytidine(34)-2'-O)-methyltransferase [Nonlabens spongiae]ARN76847.1 tRNA (uridine(34)/cytosine(34)/5-carboxymethylaminomethyluridine(34)-2'-O)-methyltransferase TrmL [Nonlabens spongiae]